MPLETREDLALAYTPGVADICKAIAEDPLKVWSLTSKKTWVAIVTDGSAVLGLGNLGPSAALPVMEGKALIFKKFADLDAFPICLDTQNTEEIISIIKGIAPSFGAINLEDIAAPKCFEIEERLKQELDIPVFHDDQHGTAIVVLAGLTNAAKVTGRTLKDMRVVINGSGAAGVAITKLLSSEGITDITVVDSRGILSEKRTDLNAEKQRLLAMTNPRKLEGGLKEALLDADVFIGVSIGNILSKEMVQNMNQDPIIFALANPNPEILPEDAIQAGAAVVATGRSDYPNQINNALVFPGIFRGAVDAFANQITNEMKRAAAQALSASVENPTAENIIPDIFDKQATERVADAVRKTWLV